MPIVPPKERIKPISHKIKGLIINIIRAVNDIVLKVFGFLDSSLEITSIIAIIPARTTDGLAPAIKTKIIIVIIETILDAFLPNSLSNINVVAKKTYVIFVP